MSFLRLQNGSTARDIAAQQGYRAVAELLVEYERRLAGEANAKTAVQGGSGGGADDVTASSEASTAATSTRASRPLRRPPAVYNRDVIPSPKNSPLKTCTPLDQYLRSNKHSHWLTSAGQTSLLSTSSRPRADRWWFRLLEILRYSLNDGHEDCLMRHCFMKSRHCWHLMQHACK